MLNTKNFNLRLVLAKFQNILYCKCDSWKTASVINLSSDCGKFSLHSII